MSLWTEADGLLWEDYSASASGISVDIALEDSYLGIGTTRGMNGD